MASSPADRIGAKAVVLGGLALAAFLAFECLGCAGHASTPREAPALSIAPVARSQQELASMKPFRSIDDAFARLVHYYDGFAPPRSDLIWTDFIERMRDVASVRMGIRQVGRAVRLEDRQEGRTLILKTPMGLAELRESLFDLVHFYRVAKKLPGLDDAGGIERVALAAMLCNLDAGSGLLSPGEMFAALPGGLREKYQRPALFEREPPAAVTCRARQASDGYALPPVGPDAREGDLYYTAVRTLTPGYAADLAGRLRLTVKDRASPLRGVILDLRGCPGGNLDEARNAADLFLSEGPAFTMYARQGPPAEFRTSTDGDENKTPLVLLIDQGCGAGCELLAATLKERGRALLIGTPTVGQVSAQMLFELPPAIGGMRLTVARFRTAQSGDIGGVGVAPDVLVADAAAPASLARDRTPPVIEINLAKDDTAWTRFAAHVLERTESASRNDLVQAAKAVVSDPEGRRATLRRASDVIARDR
jgi:hypothetical protein